MLDEKEQLTQFQHRKGKNMFSRQCIKLGSAAPLLFAAVITGGCATNYRASPEDTRDLSPAQARELLIETAQTNAWCNDRGTVVVTYKKISVSCNESRSRMSYRFSENPSFVATNVYGNECVQKIGDKGTANCAFYWRGTSARTNARDFVRAWYVLAREAPVLYLEQEAAFERAAQSYRNAKVKPLLPEEAVKYKVQAELAVQQKRFDHAVDLYDQALSIAPWWPAGHYNSGLILGELKDYEEGIRALQKYLKLEPNASNARAVQLKIYQWESLVPRAAK